ncbi:MAG: polymer-forming cytoskeletal protein [Chloroflexia bacterium]|nr:polymer-forming cytoskeletal protein [Chloroflexia bacterium]
MSGLFGGKRENMAAVANDGKAETVIGSTTSVEGAKIKSDGNLRVDGSIEGEIEVAGGLVVGKTGRVMANIRARQVFVAGAVKGDIEAPEGLDITTTGKVFGNITVGSLQIEQGGVFRGQSFMGGEGIAEPLMLEGPDQPLEGELAGEA